MKKKIFLTLKVISSIFTFFVCIMFASSIAYSAEPLIIFKWFILMVAWFVLYCLNTVNYTKYFKNL